MVGFGRDLWGSPSPTPCPSRVTHSRLHSTASRRGLNISREGDSTASLGSLFPFPHPFTFWSCFNVTRMTKRLWRILSDFSCREYSTPLCTQRKYRTEKVKFNRWVRKPLPTSRCQCYEGRVSLEITLYLDLLWPLPSRPAHRITINGIEYKWRWGIRADRRVLHCHEKAFHLLCVGLSLRNKRAEAELGPSCSVWH